MKKRLLRNRRGNVAIEFAIIAPVMLSIICGTIEFGHMYEAQTALGGALLEAARVSSASQESSEASRDAAMRASVTKTMSYFQLAAGQQLTITTTVYGDFSDSFPETFTDTNHNGRYDPPVGPIAGEPFIDRNGNGVWDAAIPKTGTEGQPGDIVSYNAKYPAAFLFSFIGKMTGQTSLTLTASVVTRNEPVKTTTS